jgi:hypothetical protein
MVSGGVSIGRWAGGAGEQARFDGRAEAGDVVALESRPVADPTSRRAPGPSRDAAECRSADVGSGGPAVSQPAAVKGTGPTGTNLVDHPDGLDLHTFQVNTGARRFGGWHARPGPDLRAALLQRERLGMASICNAAARPMPGGAIRRTARWPVGKRA